MQLENRFTVPVDAARAWDVLLDVESVVPCFPGAAVSAVAGDTIDGSVRIKLGPVLLHYAGTATFVERDPVARRAVLTASGSDKKGGGSAAATITATLRAVDQSTTECVIVTDLDITGRPAQFGRGIMTEVGNRITAQFSANLSAMLSTPVADEVPAPATDPSPEVRALRPAPPRAEALDLLQVAGGSAAKRLLPIVAVALGLLVVLWAKRRRDPKGAPSHS
jgi:carbon monoxide dehydrogenase subunit G